MPKRGRPPKQVRERQMHMVCAHVTRAQHQAIRQAAQQAGQSVSEFVLRAVQVALASNP